MADKPKINLTDEEVVDFLDADLKAAASIQDELSIKREAYYKAFRGALYGNERTGWSQSVAPVIWTNHQSRTSALLEIFSDEFFTLKSDNADRASKFQKLIRYQMFRKQDGNKRLYDFLYDCGIYHYSVFKVYRKEDYEIEQEEYSRLTAEQMLQLVQDKNRQVTKYDEVETEVRAEYRPTVDGSIPEPALPVTQTHYENVKVAKKVINYAGPCFETLPPWAFGYSPDCKLTEWGGIDGRLVYHGPFKLTLNDIRKRERAGTYRAGTYKKCQEIGNTSKEKPVDQTSVEYEVDELSSTTTETVAPSTEKDEDDLSKELSVKECYCKMDIDKDGLLEPCLIVLIEDEVVAEIDENPYKRPPFRIGGMLPEPHKIAGIAPPAKLENDQKVMTNLIRFAQDQAAMSVYRNPVTSDVRMQQMLQTRKPFDVILGDPAKIGEVPVAQGDPFILKAIELLKGDVEESTGDTRYNQGMDSESLNKTATGISLISQNSARRLRMSAKLLGNGAITGVIRDFIFINQKWKSEDPIRLLGTDIVVNPEDLDGEYDIEIDIGVSPAEKQASANQMDLLVQFGTQAGVPAGIMTPLHLLKAQKKKYSLLNINVDDCMKTEQQFMADEEQRKQQPQEENWKEYVQMDKMFEFLPPRVQAIFLTKLFDVPISPEELMQAKQQASQVPPDPNKLVDLKKTVIQTQGKMALNEQEHRYAKEQHAMDTAHKMIDHYTTLKEAQNAGVVGQQ